MGLVVVPNRSSAEVTMRAPLVIFSGSLILFASVAVGQSPPTQAPTPSSRVQRTQQDFVEVYVQDKQREFQASERAVQARNLGPHSTAIYNLLRDKKPFASFDVVGKDAAQQQQVRDALTRTVAYFLTGVGLTPDEINRLQRAGLDPLQAGANLIGATARLEDALTVSPIAVVAEVAANSPGANPVERQLTFAPRRVLKGELGQSFSMPIRLPAPPANARPGSQYLLFLSADLGPFQRAAGRRAEGTLAWVTLPYEVQGGSYVPVSPGQDPRPRSTAEVDSFMAQHPGIFKVQ